MSGTAEEESSAGVEDGAAALDAKLARVQIALSAAAVARLEAQGLPLNDEEQSAYCYTTEWIA